MDAPEQEDAVRTGMTVYGADGGKVGKVVVVGAHHFVVEKGIFFPTDYHVPNSAVARIDDNRVHLSVTKEEALTQGWDEPPAAEGFPSENVPVHAAVAPSPEATADDDSQPPADVVEGRGSLTVPVHEEELRPVTRERELGAVRIEKVVVEEARTVDVPITEERVRIRQVEAAPGATPASDAFEPATIKIPIHGEEVADVRKETRLVGAVEVEKERVERVAQVEGTVRHEEVRVDDRVVAPGQSTAEAADEVDE